MGHSACPAEETIVFVSYLIEPLREPSQGSATVSAARKNCYELKRLDMWARCLGGQNRVRNPTVATTWLAVDDAPPEVLTNAT
ncbi:hypothetical protein B0G84_8810 [Paraburkholderia sp. BL8N3]|nr:hypothetical protein B0G84_8810 [Paraburkholderia sp. BL8N3]